MINNDIVIIDPSPYHFRPYDYAAGDQRKFTREEALAAAELRVKERGCRQQVRPVRVDEEDHLTPIWLIQDI